jgi:hypothetical protein
MRKVSLFVIIVVGSFLLATTGVGVWVASMTDPDAGVKTAHIDDFMRAPADGAPLFKP